MRLIDADALQSEYMRYHDGRRIVLIDVAPTIEPERKNGKWVKEYWNGEHTRKCSSCNITQTVTTYRGKVNFNYCPYCGADMRGEQDDESRSKSNAQTDTRARGMGTTDKSSGI